MNRRIVSSSNIRSVGYLSESQILEIEFQNGAIYHYINMPEAVYRGLLLADSKGSYFYKHIRGQYTTRRVK